MGCFFSQKHDINNDLNPYHPEKNYLKMNNIQKSQLTLKDSSVVFKMDKNYNFMMQLVLLGNTGVGKTNIMQCFVNQKKIKQEYQYIATVGIDFYNKIIKINNKSINLRIWDTSGQERFQSVTKQFFKNKHGIILVYAVNDLESFKNVSRWMDQIHQNASQETVVILVGNKCDADEENIERYVQRRVVTKQQGEELAHKYNISFFETSALLGTNINELMINIAQSILNKHPNLFTIDSPSKKYIN